MLFSGWLNDIDTDIDLPVASLGGAGGDTRRKKIYEQIYKE